MALGIERKIGKGVWIPQGLATPYDYGSNDTRCRSTLANPYQCCASLTNSYDCCHGMYFCSPALDERWVINDFQTAESFQENSQCDCCNNWANEWIYVLRLGTSWFFKLFLEREGIFQDFWNWIFGWVVFPEYEPTQHDIECAGYNFFYIFITIFIGLFLVCIFAAFYSAINETAKATDMKKVTDKIQEMEKEIAQLKYNFPA